MMCYGKNGVQHSISNFFEEENGVGRSKNYLKWVDRRYSNNIQLKLK